MTQPAPFEHFDDLSPKEVEHRAMLYTARHRIWAGSIRFIISVSPEWQEWTERWERNWKK